MGVFMRDSDAFSWYMERDPALRSTVVAIAWLDASPDWDILTAKLERATRLIPMFRQTVAEPPARMAPPRWTTDGEFDLSWHLRRINAPAPHTDATVISFARIAAMTGFDRSRPLWEFTLVEHLDGDRAALVMKVHHSLTDGIGGMELALLLFDVDPVAPPPAPLPPRPRGEPLGTLDLVRSALANDCRRVAGLVCSSVVSAAPTAVNAARHPITNARESVGTALSVGRTIAPVRATLSPVMTGRGLSRQLATITVRLCDLKAASASAGGSVNDGFMAAVAGGLRRYHEVHGATVDRLRVTMPISIRTPQDPIGGNRITLIRFPVPVSETDPAVRIRAVRTLCRAARAERSLAHTNTIAGALNLLPRGVVGSMLKHVDFVASDVPGFPYPVYLGGAQVRGYVAFGPTIGASMNLTMLSYNGTCFAGATIDTAAVPDHTTLVRCLREGFEEVLSLVADHESPQLPHGGSQVDGRRNRSRNGKAPRVKDVTWST